MKFEDKGFLLNKNKYSENSVIAEFFTENNGKISGLIFGATSSKIKNFLLMGNHFNIEFTLKNQNRAGYFKLEIANIYTPYFLDDKIKLKCILYAINLIKILTAENESNKKIYFQIHKLFELLKSDDWFKKFIFWELEVIKLVGYDINFNDYFDKNKINNNDSYISTHDGLKTIPSFLLKKDDTKININELKDGFKVVGDFLNKSVLTPNNINYPLTRNELFKLI